MEIAELAQRLRSKLTEYRYARRNDVVSKHINAIEIAVCVVEYALKDHDRIDIHDRRWFNAVYEVDYLLSGSDWEELSDLYSQLVAEVRFLNYFDSK